MSAYRMRALLFALPLLIVYLWGEELFGFVFGESWSMAGRIAALMVPFYFMRFITSPISTYFAVVSKQYYSLIWQVLYAVGTFLSLYMTRSYDDIALTIKVYSYMGFGLFLVLFIMILISSDRVDKRIARSS